MSIEGFTAMLGFIGGFTLGMATVALSEVVPRLYRTIEPLLNEIIELKKKRLRDRYNDEQAANKTARGE